MQPPALELGRPEGPRPYESAWFALQVSGNPLRSITPQLAFVFALGMLSSLAPATALILNEGGIIDLASSKTGTRSFAFRKGGPQA